MPTDDNQPPVAQSRWPLYLSLALIAALLLAYALIPPFQSEVNQGAEVLASGDQDRVSEWVEQYGALGPVVIIVAMVLQMFLLVIPSVGLLIVAVLAYGGFWGTVISLAAMLTASMVGYWIGLKLAPMTVYRLVGQDSADKVQYYVERYGMWAVIITRLTPILSNDGISFVAGLLRMGFWRYLAATVIGTLPLALLIAWLGEDKDRLTTGLWWLTGLSVVAFVGYFGYQRLTGNRR